METSIRMPNISQETAVEGVGESNPEPPQQPENHSPILVPGQTCWRIEPAERAAFLVDGEAYFRAFRDAALRAKHSIMIVGWDIDTQVELVREEHPSSDMPTKLGEFLVALLRRRRKLRVYVLNWDYAVIYALERQWMPTAEPGWRRHRRLSYQMDDHHPLGASHHQKLVVIDDAVAFVGGLDLSKSRWDTRAHLSTNPCRVDADGEIYAPFHDVQMMVGGQAAAALGDLARDRWLRATGRRLSAPSGRPVEEVWPAKLTPDLMEWPIAVLRTQPRYEELEEVREIEHTYLSAIKRARRSIYIESQYFTAQAISRALAQRLSEHDGPDVVLVLRQHCDGWLERRTMDSLRARLLHDVELADHYGRLRVYAPVVPGDQGAVPVAVHSKLLIVDDEFV
jgi:phosphatidylserine/phosphatidylglycerophosphate/cardiolipin synthase-like enzyme